MSLPVFAGNVLVRLQDGTEDVAETVLDALEAAFPTRTGRGRSHVGNVWEAPQVLTPEGKWTVARSGIDAARPAAGSGPAVISSQAFDTLGAQGRSRPVPLNGGITATVLGAPADVERMAGVLAELFRAEERGRAKNGPQLEARLRLAPAAGA
ncbi:hypothetical protein [Kitasatospora sp. LaBMicrA B282]|uniref:hypothetical protein n=1 Tax=Kitasatospora sp. LaBMicrA B282 TaxID=3420949 RepID=UPI003D0C8C0F